LNYKKKPNLGSAKAFHMSPGGQRQQQKWGRFAHSRYKHWMTSMSLYNKFTDRS